MQLNQLKNRGNALFLVLIAVALFAALSYAITSSTRGSGSISKEEARIAVSKLLQYGATVRDAITRVRVVTGHNPWILDTRCYITTYNSHNLCHGNGAYTLCPDNDCRLFVWGGPNEHGWVTPLVPETTAFVADSTITNGWARRQFIHWIRIVDVGSEEPELVIVYYGLTDEACRQINKMAGVGEIIPTDSYTTIAFMNWTTHGTASVTSNIIGDDEPLLAGKDAYCIDSGVATLGNSLHMVIATF